MKVAKKMQGGKRRLADDEGHEDCSRKSAVEKTSRASESLSRSMIDKWTGAESAMLFEDPLKSAGVAKVQQMEHLVFFNSMLGQASTVAAGLGSQGCQSSSFGGLP